MGTWKPLSDLDEFVSLVKNLPREKRKVVESIGFRFVLGYNTKNIRKTMCKWVIDHFNPSSKVLTVYGEEIQITPSHVEQLLGFPDDGFDIESCVLSSPEALDQEIWKFTELGIKGMASELRKTPHDSPHFWRMFVIFTIVTVCSPRLDEKPKADWLHLVVEEEGLKSWNFAKFILNDTSRAISDFQSETNPTTLGGCPLLLMAIFCEYSITNYLSSLWKYELPRIKDWNDGNLKALHEHINKLPQGYKTTKLLAVIDKDKKRIVGILPPKFEESMERGINMILAKIDNWANATCKMFSLVLNSVDKQDQLLNQLKKEVEKDDDGDDDDDDDVTVIDNRVEDDDDDEYAEEEKQEEEPKKRTVKKQQKVNPTATVAIRRLQSSLEPKTRARRKTPFVEQLDESDNEKKNEETKDEDVVEEPKPKVDLEKDDSASIAASVKLDTEKVDATLVDSANMVTESSQLDSLDGDEDLQPANNPVEDIKQAPEADTKNAVDDSTTDSDQKNDDDVAKGVEN